MKRAGFVRAMMEMTLDSGGGVDMLRRTMRCSFCGRRDSEVAKLVAGPWRLAGRVFICDRCAAQTIQIMESHAGDDQSDDRTSIKRSVLEGGHETTRLIVALVVAVIIVLAATYWGLFQRIVVLGGQVS